MATAQAEDQTTQKDGAEERRGDLAQQIVQGLMTPSLACTDWREKWKGVNRAAGVAAGWAFALDDVAEAERLIVAVEAIFNGDDARRQLTDGLRKRVAEILVALDGEA